MSCCENRIRTEDRYLNVRKQLDGLGYHQVLGVETVSLVEHLLADLLHVTDCLHHYKDLTQKCLESQQDFELGVEPYRQDNARLLRECNELHMKLLYQQEDSERNVRELKKKVRRLERENGDLVFANSQCLARVNQLELECIQKSNSLLQLKGPAAAATAGRKKGTSQCRGVDRRGNGKVPEDGGPRGGGQGDGQWSEEGKCPQQQVESLTQLLERAKDECRQHADLAETLKLQIEARDVEIERLLGLLEGGRPLRAVCKDYSCCEKDNKVCKLEEELRAAEVRSNNLQDELKELTGNLHEAMSRAMSLADRNVELEQQLGGRPCAKQATSTLLNLQELLRTSEERAESLERDLQSCRRKCRHLEASLEAVQSDKQWLESHLDAVTKEKRKMADRIDQFLIVEQDMLEEIGRLKQGNTRQRQPREKCVHRVDQASQTSGSQQNGLGLHKPSSRSSDGRSESNRAEGGRPQALQQDDQLCRIESLKIALGESEQRLASLQRALSTAEREKCSSQAELEMLRASNTSLSKQVDDLQQALMEKEQQLAALQRDVRCLSSQRRQPQPSPPFLDQGTASRSSAHDTVLEEQLSAAMAELSQQRALYNQVKLLQQQTDGALGEARSQLGQVSGELGAARERLAGLEKERAALQREVSRLEAERSALRDSLAAVDKERDSLLITLDSKTEDAVALDQRLAKEVSRVAKLKDTVADLNNKLCVLKDESAAQDQALKSLQRTVDSLQEELSMVQQSRESAVRENRRLQDDLAAVTQDNRLAHRSLEESRCEVENLKRQLQDYVNEVRRVEDLLAHKEDERTDMLEHFRSLSVEATALETSNHSLEAEKEEARAAVQAAELRASELQQRLLDQQSATLSCEQQILELTSEVASLEARLQQQADRCERQEADLAALRQLCASIDQQKEALSNRASEVDDRKAHLEGEVARLREEQEALQEQLLTDRAAISSLEDMLVTSRQEALEQRAANHSLRSEVDRLRDKVASLQDKLDGKSAEARLLASQAADSAQQISELQREVTNERFKRVRSSEGRGYSTTL